METLKKNLANLVKVKTIVTILLTIVFCVLALTGVISGSDFITVFTVVIGFYFGTQSEKQKTVAGYTGPQQGSIEAVKDQTVLAENTMDASVQNDVHPPDADKFGPCRPADE